MADQAKIVLTLDDKQTIAELDRVGKKMDETANKAEHIGQAATEGANKAKASLGSMGDAAAKNFDKAKTAGSSMSSALNGFAAKLLTFEMAKKIGQFADQTLRAAKDMQGLSNETKAAAENYVKMTESLGKTAQAFTLGIAESVGPVLSYLADAAKQASEYWGYVFGVTPESARVKRLEAENKMLDLKKSLKALESGDMGGGVLGDNGEIENAVDNTKKQIAELSAQISNLDTVIAGFNSKAPTPKLKTGSSSGQTASKTTTKDDKWASLMSDPIWAQIDADIEANKERKRLAEENKQANIQAENELLESHKKIQDEKKAYDLKIANEIASDNAKARQATIDGERLAYVSFAESVAGLMGTLGNENKKWAKASLTLSEIVAAANTYEGVTKAYAQGGTLGFLTGATVLATGLSNVAAIEQQKQKLWTGGLIKGRNVDIRANEQGPEAVTNARATADFYPAIMAMNAGASRSQVASLAGGSSGGGMTQNITFAPTYAAGTPQTDIRRGYHEFKRTVRSIMQDPSFARVQAAI